MTPPDATGQRRLADEIERVADKIYSQNALRSRELSAIAAEVAKLEMAAESETAMPDQVMRDHRDRIVQLEDALLDIANAGPTHTGPQLASQAREALGAIPSATRLNIRAEVLEEAAQLCLMERDKAAATVPATNGSTMNIDHLLGQGWMANLLGKKIRQLKELK